MPRRYPPPRERLLARVVVRPNGCWEWTGSVSQDGYGGCGYKGKGGAKAHRAVYEELVGPIPQGMTLDHLCHTGDLSCRGGPSCLHRRCVNPGHLEPVSSEENSSRGVHGRKTHCPLGHPYSGANLKVGKNGGRYCVKCARDRAHSRRQLVAQNPDLVQPLNHRKTHCVRGHPFTEANSKVTLDGRRECRICSCIRNREYRQRASKARLAAKSGVAA